MLRRTAHTFGKYCTYVIKSQTWFVFFQIITEFVSIVLLVLFHFRSLAMSMLVRKQYLVEDSCFAFEMEDSNS